MKLSVLIPYRPDEGHRADLFEWVLERYEKLLPSVEVCVGWNGDPTFNRAAARNRAFDHSTGEMLLIADADTIFHPEQIAWAVSMIMDGASWVIPYGLGRYYNLSEQRTIELLKTDPRAYVYEPTDPNDWEFKLDSSAGLLVVPRAAYEAVGGYDEQFIGWGYEDDAFRAALDHRVGHHQRVNGCYCLHLWHPATADERFEQGNIIANRERYWRYESGELP